MATALDGAPFLDEPHTGERDDVWWIVGTLDGKLFLERLARPDLHLKEQFSSTPTLAYLFVDEQQVHNFLKGRPELMAYTYEIRNQEGVLMADDNETDEFYVAAVSPHCVIGLRRNKEGMTPGVLVPVPEGGTLDPNAEVVQGELSDDGAVIRLSPGKGPAKVSSPTYRDNYAKVFSNRRKKSRGLPN